MFTGDLAAIWLWQPDDWQQLDVSSWYARINSYLPSAHAIDGVSPARFRKPTFRAGFW